MTLSLSTFPHYFIQWLGNEKITTQFAKKRKHYEWGPHKVVEQGDPQHKVIEEAIYPLISTFLEIMSGGLDEAAKTLESVESAVSFLNENELIQEYLPGILLLFKLVKTHFNAVLHELSIEQTDLCQTTVENEYETLGEKGKCVFAVAHWMLDDAIPGREEKALENLEFLITIEENWYWYFKKYNRTRFSRVTLNKRSSPGNEELEAASSAVRLAQNSTSKDQVICKSGLSQCLAEIVRARAGDRDQRVISRDLKFPNFKELVEAIKAYARGALATDSCEFKQLYRYGEIFGLILPARYRDYYLAQECLKVALTKSPDSSKVHHKMGSVLLNSNGNSEEVIRFLIRAVEIDPPNYPAWMDLLPALLMDFEANGARWERLMKDANTVDCWTPIQRGNFLFYDGCWSFLQENLNAALRHWSLAVKAKTYGFDYLGNMGSRFRWPKDRCVTYDAILTAISHLDCNELDAELTADELNYIRDEVQAAKEKALESFTTHRSSFNPRPRRNLDQGQSFQGSSGQFWKN